MVSRHWRNSLVWCRQCVCPMTVPVFAPMPHTTRWFHDAGSHSCAPQPVPLQGQQQLVSIERLDLCLLIDAQDEDFVWRAQIEPDNVSDFLNEQRIGRQLARLLVMRLQPKCAPNPTDGALAQVGRRRHRTTTPMHGIRRSRLQGPGHHVLDVRIGNPTRRTWAGLVQQAIQPLLLRHRVIQLTGRAAQDQPSPLRQGLRRRTTTRPPFKGVMFGQCQRKGWSSSTQQSPPLCRGLIERTRYSMNF